MDKTDESLHWYAFRTFWQSQKSFIAKMQSEQVETYVPERIVGAAFPDDDDETVDKASQPSRKQPGVSQHTNPQTNQQTNQKTSQQTNKKTNLFPSLVFIRVTSKRAKELQCDATLKATSYNEVGTSTPAIIRDSEMETFMWVTKVGCKVVEPVDINLVKGDRVRVTDGLFKGAEGRICRVKGTKRFVVSIEGVVAVATAYIPRKFLEKIETEEIENDVQMK